MLEHFAVAVGLFAAVARARERPGATFGEVMLHGVGHGVGAYAAGRLALAVRDSVRSRTRPRVFISYHFGPDGDFKDELARLGVDGKAGFELEDVSVSTRIRSRNRSRIRAALTRRVRGADKVLVVVGRHTHARPYVHHEVEVALEEGKPIVAVKLHPSFTAPPQLYGRGVAWASLNAESIRDALRRAT